MTAGQLIGHATGGGIEVGWAAPPGTGQTMAAASGQDKAGLAQGDPGYYPTAYGVNFSNLIRSLGGPAGIVSGPVQGTQPGAAAAQTGNQQTGGTQTSDQQPGDQQAGDQESGETQTGAAQPSPAQPGPAQTGDSQSSPAQPGSTPGTTGGYLQQAAQGTGLPLSVVRAQVQVESGGRVRCDIPSRCRRTVPVHALDVGNTGLPSWPGIQLGDVNARLHQLYEAAPRLVWRERPAGARGVQRGAGKLAGWPRLRRPDPLDGRAVKLSRRTALQLGGHL